MVPSVRSYGNPLGAVGEDRQVHPLVAKREVATAADRVDQVPAIRLTPDRAAGLAGGAPDGASPRRPSRAVVARAAMRASVTVFAVVTGAAVDRCLSPPEQIRGQAAAWVGTDLGRNTGSSVR